MAMIRIKLSKRNTHMVTPGIQGNSITDTPGSAGMVLDYRAYQIGDSNQISFTDDEMKKGPINIRRADDFKETGNYLVETPHGIKTIYRDPESGWWYEDAKYDSHRYQGALGFTKIEALTKLLKKYPKTNEISDEYVEQLTKEEKRFAKKVMNLMVDLSGDDDWFKADLEKIWGWVGSFNTPEEATDFLMADSVQPHHCGVNSQFEQINDTSDLYSGNFSNEHYNNEPIDENKARGAFVGSKEEGQELKGLMGTFNVNKIATKEKKITAVIVKGNPKFIKESKIAHLFYDEIKEYLESSGYEVSFDVGKAYTTPKKADLWIGHSKGVDRLSHYDKDDIKLLGFGALPEKTDNSNIIFVNHPKDEKYLRNCLKNNKYDTPIDEHYIFTNEMKKAIDAATKKIIKKAYPNYQEYSDPELYEQYNERTKEIVKPPLDIFNDYFCSMLDDVIETKEELDKKAFPDYAPYNSDQMYKQVTEEQDYNMTPAFDTLSVYYADDKKSFYKSHWFDWEHNKGRHNMGNEMWAEIESDLPNLLKSNIAENEINQWVKSLQIRMGIQPKNFPIIKKIIDDFHSKPDKDIIKTMEGLYDVLRQYSKTDTEWIKHNTNKIESNEDIIEVIDELLNKKAFKKTAVSYDSNQVIQDLIKIPQVKALIDQQASGYVDQIKVTTPSTDIEFTKQQVPAGQQPLDLEPITGNPYGHMFVSEDPITHQKKPLDKIVRIDRVTDAWGTLNTILHEVAHARHPDWSESQVEAEALRNADTVKQFLTPKSAKKKILFVKNSLSRLPVIEADIADTYQKQVTGLQNHTSLSPNAGMIFNYASPQPLSFHMGTVKFPIDIVFANNDTIVKIYRSCKPNSLEIYSCDKATKVIEVVSSFCAFHDLDVGDRVFYSDDDVYNQEDFTKYILERIQKIKLVEQKDLKMTDWNVKVVMKKEPDSRRFLKVNWSPEDYAIKKADILVNPDPILIEAALKTMPLDKLVRHSLLHILTGHKKELPEDKEDALITSRLFKSVQDKALQNKLATNKSK